MAYAPYKGAIEGRRNGVLISTGDGEAVAYALWYLEERGKLFIMPGTKVYQGMIIGENARDNDLDVNPLRAKQLTNIRTTQQGRGGAADPGRADDAGTVHRLHRGRRAGRSDAAIHPPAQTRTVAPSAQARKGRRLAFDAASVPTGLRRPCRPRVLVASQQQWPEVCSGFSV